MFGWIASTKSLRETARTLTNSFAEDCPPPRNQNPSKRVSEKKVAVALDRLYAQAADYIRERRLGVIGRARLAKAFQAEMQALGYPPELVGKLTSALTINALVADPKQDRSARS